MWVGGVAAEGTKAQRNVQTIWSWDVGTAWDDKRVERPCAPSFTQQDSAQCGDSLNDALE